MTIITSKRHKVSFYLAIGSVVLVSGGFGLFFILKFIDLYQNQELKPKDQLLPFIGGGLLLLAIYTIPRIYKNAPSIVLDAEKISFKSFGKADTYYLKDIVTLELTGKQPFRYLYNVPMEGARLIFKDGQIKYIFDSVYANIWQIKSYLQESVLGKKADSNLPLNKDYSDLEFEEIDFFKGNQFTSFQGIFLWGSVVIFASVLLRKPQASLTAALIIILWLLIFSWFMHYFGVSENYLVIRNHTLLWINRRYRLPDVKEVVFEQEGKRPNCLRVITQDFRSKLYPAGTLRDKHWLSLRDELEKNNIIVRNECINDKEKDTY